ncbi:NAD-dependent epimerase/dehydratase family protein, partial [Vibrio parahaemolyticus]
MTRTLVVTGAAGFVGAHLCRIAAEAGFSVFAIGR